MKHFMFSLLLISLTFIASACVSYPAETLTHEDEQDGLALKATITKGNNITIDASITNTSGETLIYNGRCGIPFSISVKQADAHAYLTARNSKIEVCDSVFDPNDLREMKPNETFTKKLVFKREVYMSNERTVGALSGMYEVIFSFQLHEKERMITSVPIELVINKESEIMTVEQARMAAKENAEVNQWFVTHEKGGAMIEFEEPILSDGMWTVIFHAIFADKADRIIINMDAVTGEIKGVYNQEISKEVLEMIR